MATSLPSLLTTSRLPANLPPRAAAALLRPRTRDHNVAFGGQSPVSFYEPMLERGCDGIRGYARSTLALSPFTFELAGQLEGAGVATKCLRPVTLMGTNDAQILHTTNPSEEKPSRRLHLTGR